MSYKPHDCKGKHILGKDGICKMCLWRKSDVTE